MFVHQDLSAGMRHRLQTFSFNVEIDLLENSGYYQPSPKTLGEYIRKTRLDRKLTAKELSKQIGCSDDILLSWEMDRRIPRIGHLKKLNEVLGVPHEFLREAIAKSYSLSEKERDMLFEMDLIPEKLSRCEKGNAREYSSLLRIYRLSLLLGHKEFAKILGVDASTVLDWEKGRREAIKNSKYSFR